jgi:hypothetical protein
VARIPDVEAPLATNGARALAAAVTQIDVALREARTPVEQLGSLIERMAGTLDCLRAESSQLGRQSIEALQSDLYGSIQQLQFYDRMVQHLSHVQDYLSAVADQLASVAVNGDDADAWDELRARLRTRLISDAQRELLDLVLLPAGGVSTTREAALEERARQGSIELF